MPSRDVAVVHLGQEDIFGMDHLARAFVRVVARMPPAGLVAVHGAPGSGKEEFLQRVAWLVSHESRSLGLEASQTLCGEVVWFNPWSFSKQGNVLTGLVSRVARMGGGAAQQERARDVVAQVNRMRFDGEMPAAGGTAFNEGELDTVERLQRGFVELTEAVKGGRLGRLLIFVEELDLLAPSLRWHTIDGIRLLMGGGADVTVILSIGRESAAAAVRSLEGDIPDTSVQRMLDDVLDLAVTVPSLEVRRIGSLLRRTLGTGEAKLRRAFGDDAVRALSAAIAHRPLGAPRFVVRLAHAVILLAEYALEINVTRELSEAQWAWVIVSERWPDFRRFMIRGGLGRWQALQRAMSRTTALSAEGELEPEDIEMQQWLTRDPILADYLRLHADGFARDSDGIIWLENLLLSGGI